MWQASREDSRERVRQKKRQTLRSGFGGVFSRASGAKDG
jgi:hypothetical protein